MQVVFQHGNIKVCVKYMCEFKYLCLVYLKIAIIRIEYSSLHFSPAGLPSNGLVEWSGICVAEELGKFIGSGYNEAAIGIIINL
jgi:hypothetical protein